MIDVKLTDLVFEVNRFSYILNKKMVEIVVQPHFVGVFLLDLFLFHISFVLAFFSQYTFSDT